MRFSISSRLSPLMSSIAIADTYTVTIAIAYFNAAAAFAGNDLALQTAINTLINEIKAKAQEVGELVERMLGDVLRIDARSAAICVSE